jgi:hypothetical protein
VEAHEEPHPEEPQGPEGKEEEEGSPRFHQPGVAGKPGQDSGKPLREQHPEDVAVADEGVRRRVRPEEVGLEVLGDGVQEVGGEGEEQKGEENRGADRLGDGPAEEGRPDASGPL